MSTEALWIVIESVNLIQLPIMTYDYNSNFTELEQLLSESQWRAAFFHLDHYKIFNSNLMLLQNMQIFILSALYMMLLALKVFNRFTLKSLLGVSMALLIGTLFGRQLPYIYLPLFILLILLLLIRTDWKFTSFKLISTLIIGLLTLFTSMKFGINELNKNILIHKNY